jgi:uncharacterized protein (UPF0276 family)
MSIDGSLKMPRPEAGIGLKAEHMADILAQRPALDFLEIHAENFMGQGGTPHRWLSRLREDFALSVHGVGLSLGSDQPLDLEHLEKLARVVERYQPRLVSEHLAWSVIDGHYLNDLLPIPYDDDSLAVVAQHVDQVQTRLKRKILVENPASYIAFADSPIHEAEFLAALTRTTGCGILLDVNNIYVSHRNVGLTIADYFTALPASAIGEIHLAGHHVRQVGTAEIRIDDHGSPVCDAVWQLYRDALAQVGPVPSLIERDSNIPPLAELVAEAALARQIQAERIGYHVPVA